MGLGVPSGFANGSSDLSGVSYPESVPTFQEPR